MTDPVCARRRGFALGRNRLSKPTLHNDLRCFDCQEFGVLFQVLAVLCAQFGSHRLNHWS